MKFFKNSLVKIPLWRYITVGILLIGLSISTVKNNVDENVFLSLQETLLSTTGAVFNLYFILLLLIADLGFDYQKADAQKHTFHPFRSRIGFASALCLLFVLWLAVCNFFALFLKTGTITFSNTLINTPLYELENINASFAAIFNLVLIYLYFVFISTIVFTINCHCKERPLGYLGVLTISVLHVIVYTFFSFPLGFFPTEYASVGSALLVTPSIPLNIVISVLYWLVLIAATGLIYHIVNKRNKGGQLL